MLSYSIIQIQQVVQERNVLLKLIINMKRYSGKTIAIGTAIGIIAVLYIAYSFAVKKTIEIRSQNKELRETIEQIQIASHTIEQLQQTLEQFQYKYGNSYVLHTDFQSALIKMIADFCEQNNMQITLFPTSHEFVKNDFSIQSYQITVTGSFIEHVKLLSTLELQLPGARIASVLFEKKTDIRRKTQILYMTVLIQKIQEQKT